MATTAAFERQRAVFLESRPKPLLANAQFGTTLLVATELMFFMALISAYLVIKASSLYQWMPPTGAMLPIGVTLVNTLVLFGSGLCLVLGARRYSRIRASGSVQDATTKALVMQAALMGAVFVAVQGYEWFELFRQGMTLTSGIFGACFYLLVGSHAAHAFAGVLALVWGAGKLRKGTLSPEGLWGLVIFWSFVVAVWPILYGLAYFP